MKTTNAERRLLNYLRAHRRNAGLSQGDVARVLGYANQGPISRHEHFRDVPPLEIAIGYEIVFRIPVSEIFAGMREELEMDIERRLQAFETALGARSMSDRNAVAISRKLMWLKERKTVEYESFP